MAVIKRKILIFHVFNRMLFGVYEIGYSIEDPFQGTLRLSILCDQIRRDVLDNEIIMNSAYDVSQRIPFHFG